MSGRVTPFQVVRGLIVRPYQNIVCKWNWKSAIFSSVIRALIFFFANLRAGWHAAAGAMFAEFVYRALTTGFYGAMTQAFREAEPPWLAFVFAGVLLPICSHSIELCVHIPRHTPKIVASVIASASFTVLSTHFMLYAMRRGSFVVGAGCRSINQDIKDIPRIVGGFLSEGPRCLRDALKRSCFRPRPICE